MMAADGSNFLKAPPVIFAPESELAIIGAAMLDHATREDLLDRVAPGVMGEHVHDLTWEAIRRIHKRGGTPHPAMVRDEIGINEPFQQWGGYDTLFNALDAASTLGLADHVAAVVDRAMRRKLQALTRDVGQATLDTAGLSAEALLAELEQGAVEIGRSVSTADHWLGAADMVDAALDSAEARNGRIDYPLGLTALDDMLGGCHAEEVTLVAGRPGMAKSTAAGRMALSAARAGKGVAFYSLEMGQEPMGLRLACDLAWRGPERGSDGRLIVFSMSPDHQNPTVTAAAANRLTDGQRKRLREAAAEIRELPLMFDTRSGLTLSQIEASARRRFRDWERRGIEPGPIFIDHLGKVRPEKDRKGSKHAETADVSNGLSELAKRLHVPVIALCQLNREVERRGGDKRPVLSDLRQAGELEEDARQIVFLYRPEYYLRPPRETVEDAAEKAVRIKDLKKVANKLFFIVEKNSHGPTGQIEAFCDVACSVVRDA